MAIDTSVPQSRRALLACGLGGLAALVSSALGRPPTASAADGQTILVGGEYDASSVTKLTNLSNASTVLAARTGGGIGIYGEATSGFGVWGKSASLLGVEGTSTSGAGVHGNSHSGNGIEGSSGLGHGVDGYSLSGTGVFGRNDSDVLPAAIAWARQGCTGMLGYSGEEAPPTAPPKTSVHGYAAQDANARGVHGQSTAGRGVFGQATTGLGVRGYATSGTGVWAEATTGYALRTTGRLRIEKASGVATILAGNTVVKVTPGLDVTSASFVLLTPKGDPGSRRLWYTVDTAANTFSIKVSSAVPTDLRIGWLLVG